MDELRATMQIQTELLRTLNDNISGLREDMRSAQAKGMNDAMAQVLGSLKGTPMEGIVAQMMSKMKSGGTNG